MNVGPIAKYYMVLSKIAKSKLMQHMMQYAYFETSRVLSFMAKISRKQQCFIQTVQSNELVDL